MVHLNSSPRPLQKQGGGVTELISETTVSFYRLGDAYTGYKRSITFPSDYKEAEILIYGKSVYGIIANRQLKFGFTLSKLNGETKFYRNNTIIDLKSSSFDNYISRIENSSTSGTKSYFEESLTDFIPEDSYFIIRGRIFPQESSANTKMVFCGNITTDRRIIHLHYQVSEKLTEMYIATFEHDYITDRGVILKATCYS